ncbi:MAG: TfuA-related McrA-glycine thioamidation protein [Methanomassiliicoccales archaeon]|nr:TfuA-related McrA-glycine thioamidation protein [Methanomassiliicoccales archaeon]
MIFLGPSLPQSEAREKLDADYRPPVKRGDLESLPSGTNMVGIIDGLFMSESAVGHREILSLLQSGIKVIGGGSMGALRAAELSDFGMIGVGRVYEMYASGVIDGDDEVALVFNPETLEPLSEPLVNIRFNISEAAANGAISAAEANELIEQMRRVYFPERSYPLLVEKAHSVLDREGSRRLKEFLRSNAKDLKKSDALMVIATIKTLIKSEEY